MTRPLSPDSSALSQLTPVQADAVRATAAAHLRKAEELAVELYPLLADRLEDPQSVTDQLPATDAPTTEIPLSAVKAALTPANGA